MISTTFHSSKGGVGKTNLALNYAGYKVLHGFDVWFIEFHWGLGNVISSFSYLRPPISVSEYVLGTKTTFSEVLCNATELFDKTPRKNSFNVALVTEEPEDLNSIRSKTFRVRSDESMLLRLIDIEEAAQRREDETGIPMAIIYDTTPGIEPMAMEAVTLANRIVMVSRPTRAQYRETSTIVDIIRHVKLDVGKIGLVVNQVLGEPKDPRIIELIREAEETSTIPVIGIVNVLAGFEDAVYTFGNRPERVMKIDLADAHVIQGVLNQICLQIDEF